MSHTGMDTSLFRNSALDRSRQTSFTGVKAVSLSFDTGIASDRLHLVEALVHAADLGGQAYTPDVANLWGALVIEEFEAQAKKELAANLPVAPFMACLGTPLAMHKTQLSFIDIVMAPLWRSLGDLLPGLDQPLSNIRTNRAHHAIQVERLRRGIGGSIPPMPPSGSLTPASSVYSVAEQVTHMDQLHLRANTISEVSEEGTSPVHRSPQAGSTASRSLEDFEAGHDGI